LRRRENTGKVDDGGLAWKSLVIAAVMVVAKKQRVLC